MHPYGVIFFVLAAVYCGTLGLLHVRAGQLQRQKREAEAENEAPLLNLPQSPQAEQYKPLSP